MTLTRSFNKDNNTRLITSSRTPTNSSTDVDEESCTGCAIEAYYPVTTFFNPQDSSNRWESIVVTETVVTEYITYIHNSTIDGSTIEIKTINQTRTVVSNEVPITLSTPYFLITPTPGVILTVDAGPTYVMYPSLFGGLDRYTSEVYTAFDITLTECGPMPTQLKNWQPVETSDWSLFVETFKDGAPQPTETNLPVPIPTNASAYLRNNLAIRSQFNGSDIATCTLHRTNGGIALPTTLPNPVFTFISNPLPIAPSRTMATDPQAFPTMAPPLFTTLPASTYLSTTYDYTSSHVTRAGCLRCPDASPSRPADTNVNDNSDQKPNEQQPSYTPIPPPKPPTDRPADPQPPQNEPGRDVTIGDTVVNVRPTNPVQNPDRPQEQNQDRPPLVIVGTNTLTQGQSTVINGVPVVVPVDGGGSRIVIGGTTIPINAAPTGPPVLTVGQNTITANPQGQFVVGTQTLQPGGPAIIVDGSTLSLGPSGSIAIVNGVTQTLANAPFITAPPVLTAGDKAITATVIGGSTQFVFGGQTLAPGAAITVDGTTFSMPADGQGRTIIVNGATSTFAPGQSVLPIGNQGVTATVQDGTTAFIFGPGQTLTPGGVVTVSGTTFSMPASGAGSVVVINGVTTTLGRGPVTAAPALTVDGKTYSATVRDGTTEYVLGQGTTLRPGQAITVSGTTYSLDSSGTALIINGKTSTIPRTPASNSASTTRTSGRDVGNFVWSGIGGGSTSKGGAAQIHAGGLDKWAEGMLIGVAGWLMMLF